MVSPITRRPTHAGSTPDSTENEVSLDNPDPCQHRMTGPSEPEVGSSLQFSLDRLAMNIHGNADSHLDALTHVQYQGTLYNGVRADKVGVRRDRVVP